MPRTPEYPLQSSLPADVLVAGNALWSRYRHYPVFSWPWFSRRTLVFAVPIVAWGLLSVLGVAASGDGYLQGLVGAGYMVVSFLLMATAGPGLATLVRHRRWPLRREQVAVVVALLFGMACSFVIDSFASRRIAAILAGMPGQPETAEAVVQSMQPGSPLLRFALPVLVYSLFGGGLALRAYFSERRRWRSSLDKREKAELRAQRHDAEMRLGVLQAQVEPHFLFNTLASVRALVRQDPGRAEATLDALVEHLRVTIPKLREDGKLLSSTLGQQLDVCSSYLALMRLRIGERLEYAFDAPDGLRACPYPPLLLITLVENAIKHGVEPCPGSRRIDVRARREQGTLVVRVEDDGAGLQPGVGGGVGLANVREQLAMHYEGRAGFRLDGREGGGVRAEIRVPLEEPRS